VESPIRVATKLADDKHRRQSPAALITLRRPVQDAVSADLAQVPAV